ncbi:MAG: hypothetical protein IKU55_02860, partial [Clostridia bacterium]|nr:hypothetical protein [Clostridia bacterium]
YDAAISESTYDGALQFYVVGRYGTKRFGSYYPINAYTPKTLAAVVNEVNKDDAETLEALIARLQRNEDEPSYGYIQLDVYDDEIQQSLVFEYQRYAYENGGMWTGFENGGKPREANEEALAVMKRAAEILPQASENIDPDAPLVLLRYYVQYFEQGNNSTNWGNYEGMVLLPVDEADLNVLLPQFGE